MSIVKQDSYIHAELEFCNEYKLSVNKQLVDGDIHLWLTLWNSNKSIKIQYDLYKDDDAEVAIFAKETVQVLKEKLGV
jgi:hypothetical protein